MLAKHKIILSGPNNAVPHEVQLQLWLILEELFVALVYFSFIFLNHKNKSKSYFHK